MEIAALITWLVTALGGFYMLGTWIARGGVRQQKTGESKLPAPVIFGHFLLAAAGLVVWIIYLFADATALAWLAFGLLVPVALLGFVMLARWIPVHRGRVARLGSGPAPAEGAPVPAERGFPVPVVAGHGLFAVATVVLVLLSALGVGGS
ncbi:hypothetical protein DMB42_49670 [Nonomuraea sp. WAC 01424]|uniref:hypothetical protein n=1 Tax=Nonomuraea sp. WAC 01424 TaxID=2203200 RepID=UPI000F783759|nr:hypothetical protein [Nonomuraea sp. WAC 01424]RSM95625.1 hypothetical protein DMB42_49670 [Nonomuraea sp. WAC 01424]